MPTLPNELWLVGSICAGKDFIADVLAERFGYWRMGVGQLIAEELELMEGLAPGTIYADAATKDRYRLKLQEHGNARRREDPGYWFKRWIDRRDLMRHRPAVMTSCRLVREAQVAIQRGAVVVRVTTPEPIRRERIARLYPSHRAHHDTNDAEAQIALVPYHIEIPGQLSADFIPTVLETAYADWLAGGCPVHDPSAVQSARPEAPHGPPHEPTQDAA